MCSRLAPVWSRAGTRGSRGDDTARRPVPGLSAAERECISRLLARVGVARADGLRLRAARSMPDATSRSSLAFWPGVLRPSCPARCRRSSRM
jgi:hypothetical protein